MKGTYANSLAEAFDDCDAPLRDVPLARRLDGGAEAASTAQAAAYALATILQSLADSGARWPTTMAESEFYTHAATLARLVVETTDYALGALTVGVDAAETAAKR